MKNIIALFLLLSLPVFGANYDNSTKYPELSISSSLIKLYANDVLLTPSYSQLYTAEAAALNIAIECSCEVRITIPDRLVKVRWRDNPNFVPDNTTSPTVFNWKRPTKRYNGDILSLQEIGGFEVYSVVDGESRYELLSSTTLSKEYTKIPETVKVRVFDSDGLYSEWLVLKGV